MARPRRQTYTLKQYLDNVKEGYISNDADTQRNPAWQSIIDGIAVTVLTDDYIPPIILAEEDSGQNHIADGGSRTAALQMIISGNYKIKSSVENSIIEYKSMSKNEDGETVWTDEKFDIKNKTFEQFPKELQKKFDEYQIETVIHEHCDKEKIAMYIKRYNEHSSMNANQKMFVYLPKFASKIRKITNRKFFIHNSVFTDNNKEKGLLERVVSESVMCMFHFDKWNKNGKNLASYLNENANEEEFETLNQNMARLENIVTDETKSLFNDKNTFIWLTFFNQFTKLGLDDSKFAEFLHSFVNGLRDKAVDGKLFDTVDETGSTKDKAVIASKLHILETLMHEFLLINKEDLEEVNTLEFVKENVDSTITEEDIDFHNDNLNAWIVGIDEKSRLNDEKNKPSMIAIAIYAFENEEACDDETMIEWFADYESRNKMYILNQKNNFLHMKQDLDKLIVNRACI